MLQGRYFYITIFLLSISVSLYGQSYQSENYTTNDGLPSSEVFQVLQDSKGYVWFATNQGVSRYNGYEFKNFDIQDGLPENTILMLYEDYRKRVWFITMLGNLGWFENDSVFKYPYNSVIQNYDKKKLHAMKRCFHVDTMDNVFIGFYNSGLFKIDREGKLEELIAYGETIETVLRRVGEKSVIYNFQPNFKSFVLIDRDYTDTIRIKENDIGSLRMVSIYDKGKFWVSRLRTLLVLEKGSYLFRKFEHEIIWLSSDNNQKVWVGTIGDGAIAYNGTDFDNPSIHVLKGKSVSSVYQDSEGGYWFTTLGNGVYYFPTLQVESLDKSNGINLSFVNELEHHNNKIWFGGNGNNLYTFDLKSLNTFPISKRVNVECKLLKSLGDTLAVSFVGDADHKVLLISENENVWKSSFYCREAVDFDDGVYFFEKQMRTLSHGEVALQYLTERKMSIYSVLIVSEDSFWLGTEDGLYSYNKGSASAEKHQWHPLLKNRINILYKDKDWVWIGTKGAGLLKVDEDSVQQFTIKDGLPGNSVNEIVKDGDVLWLATNNGIGKVNFQNDANGEIESIESFTREDGLLNNEIYDIDVLKNYVFAGTNKGVSYFPRDLSSINQKQPPIYITGFKVMGKEMDIKYQHVFDYDEDNVELSFIGLSYKKDSKLEYLYKMEGVDKDWLRTSSRSIQYSMLLPGKYTFLVKAVNNSGVESIEPAIVRFQIKKAYYQTLAFRLGAVILFVAITFLSYALVLRFRLREQRKRMLLKSELDRSRQQALNATMNPHFLFNSLNSIQSYILRNEIDKSSEYLTKYSGLMRKVLNNSQHQLISLKEEIDALQDSIDLELLHEDDCFLYNLEVDENLDLDKIKIPSLLLQPYVENAINHGLRNKEGDKELSVKVFRDADRLLIHIEDNGVGREKAQEIKKRMCKIHKSMGTEITQNRIKLFREVYKNDIKVNIFDLYSEKEGSGTRVEIEMTLK